VSDFGSRVVGWYDQHGRKDLPWQQDQEAYRVWVSEIMLQQTQVQTVIPYYERFMQSFPDVVTLSNSSMDEVLHHWSGLGYYARARNLHRAAEIIRDEYSGAFPHAFDQVENLPGIGRSTAGAILSLAFGQRWPILDGNVKRVLARHAAISGWPGKTSVATRLWSLAEQRTPMDRAEAYTQAIMDLGATVCTRSSPDCTRCPVNKDCRALSLDEVAAYPGRKPKKAKPQKQISMLLAVHNGAIYLERRPAAGIWGGLWSLPEIDGSNVNDWCQRVLSSKAVKVTNWALLRHSFSHYDLDIQPILVRFESASSTVADNSDATWLHLDESPPGGIAAPVSKLINSLKTGNHVQNN
jgi:A/G-specific adenine glycosylase